MTVALRTASPADLDWVASAVRTCPVALAEFGGFYGEAPTRLAPLLGDDRVLHVIEEDGERVGFIDLDGDGLSYFVVAPARHRGVATSALRSLAARRPDRPLIAAVDPANTASLRTAAAAGFRRTGVNTWGEVVLERPPDVAP